MENTGSTQSSAPAVLETFDTPSEIQQGYDGDSKPQGKGASLKKLGTKPVSSEEFETEIEDTEELQDEDGDATEGLEYIEEGEENEDSKIPSEEDSSEEESSEESPKQKEVKAKAKILKVKSGDRDVTIRTDAEVPVVVKGKKVMVPLAKLQENYSGDVVYTEKFKQLEEDKNKFHTERDYVTSSIKRFHNLAMTEGKAIEAVQFLFQSMGADPVEGWKGLKKQILTNLRGKIPGLEEISDDLTPEEEVAWYKTRDSLKKEQEEEVSLKQTLTQKIESVKAEYGIDDEQFRSAYIDLMKQGHKNILPEHVAEFLATTKGDRGVRTLVTSLGIKQTPEIIADLQRTKAANDFTDEELKEYAVLMYGAPKAASMAPIAKKLKSKIPPQAKKPTVARDEFDTF